MWSLQKKYSWSYISVLWLVVILILLFISSEDIEIKQPELFPHADKLVHAGLFVIWAYCLCRASLQQFHFIKYVPISVGIISIGILTEILQGMTTYRTSDPWDVIADIVGGLVILMFFRFFLK
ncbi:MAG: VanZ family protein [Saprospiraceae bacterium]|jgi:VanZ family protein